MTMKKLLLPISIALMLFGCDETSLNENSSTEGSCTSVLSSSSAAAGVVDTIPLSQLGSLSVTIHNSYTGAISTVSTAATKTITDTSVTVEFNTLDTFDSWSWMPTMNGPEYVEISYSITTPILASKVKGIYARSTQNNPDNKSDSARILASGFFLESNEGLGYTNTRPQDISFESVKFSDSNDDGWIYNLNLNYNSSSDNLQVCTDGLCTYQVCETSQCQFISANFYFGVQPNRYDIGYNSATNTRINSPWYSEGTLTINGLSLIMEK